jgi:hypothetical protein
LKRRNQLNLFRSGRLLLIAPIIGAVALMSSLSPAAAAGAGGIAVIGQGTIKPGLSALPTQQAVNFGGTATGAFVTTGGGATVLNGTACNFAGNSSSTGDNYVVGLGTVAGGCGTQIQCTVVTYVRVGAIVLIDAVLTCTVSGQTISATGAFVFEANVPSPPTAPITSYTLQGVSVGAGAP